MYLAASNLSIKKILDTYGLPPIFQRPFSFETLVQIILEQQVSLASARAALNRLQTKLVNITPHGLLQLDADQMRACSVSRQKAGYLHHLAQTVSAGNLKLSQIANAPDEEVRQQLMQVKGIGPWTADIVLMMCLQRPDVFPTGDVALINSVKHQHDEPEWTIVEIAEYAQRYAPYRTMATYCYWHAYIQRKNITAAV